VDDAITRIERMAKLILIIEDHGDTGGITIALQGQETFPAHTKEWTPAQRAAMWAYHALGTPGQDLATTDAEGEG
jgi:hypothetical protein